MLRGSVDGHFGYCLFPLNLWDKGKYWQSSTQLTLEVYSSYLRFQNPSISCWSAQNEFWYSKSFSYHENIFLSSKDHSWSSRTWFLIVELVPWNKEEEDLSCKLRNDSQGYWGCHLFIVYCGSEKETWTHVLVISVCWVVMWQYSLPTNSAAIIMAIESRFCTSTFINISDTCIYGPNGTTTYWKTFTR